MTPMLFNSLFPSLCRLQCYILICYAAIASFTCWKERNKHFKVFSDWVARDPSQNKLTMSVMWMRNLDQNFTCSWVNRWKRFVILKSIVKVYQMYNISELKTQKCHALANWFVMTTYHCQQHPRRKILEVKSLQNVHEDVLVHSADENRLLEEL